jgi:hypothetical protein
LTSIDKLELGRCQTCAVNLGGAYGRLNGLAYYIIAETS